MDHVAIVSGIGVGALVGMPVVGGSLMTPLLLPVSELHRRSPSAPPVVRSGHHI